MSRATLETFYEALAAAIDNVGPERETVFLAKLSLLLAHELADPDRAISCIAEAGRDRRAVGSGAGNGS